MPYTLELLKQRFPSMPIIDPKDTISHLFTVSGISCQAKPLDSQRILPVIETPDETLIEELFAQKKITAISTSKPDLPPVIVDGHVCFVIVSGENPLYVHIPESVAKDLKAT